MNKTPRPVIQVISDVVGDKTAAEIIDRLERYGYRIIRHRVVPDEEVPEDGPSATIRMIMKRFRASVASFPKP